MPEDLKFIKGRFSPAEAAEILLSVLNNKIQFHALKSLNLRIEDHDLNFNSEKRIKELKEAKKTIEKMVLKAHNEDLYIEINSSIKVNLISRDGQQS
ncbi:hypothetical protein [Christiangramia sabulilitoris]|uniref:Uncharacterized protein n=1 Tax=Christiangramia sabulilitoris TaxID=2583991 RepID=A0A550I7N0_9FLAO|nr:hypothetical protein [Christiangramia sabulilitoris]TRO66975.1 hypothetical protein FGM01_03540 [Christiangramia sabulilitoris]